ncbi:hypothetical protein DM02DRAFT_613155 [Periconia macrospinosa]|uniref:Phosphatidate phosphatase APP1 catalytic domain-containing protein n=1 Tax=Periconia macrospinosa TaxID=97972 RepID=A0A2V1DW89_9PLEO|nr:hypothetical protein DM02DRAFT_613155 [Periconia macrospinosa]
MSQFALSALLLAAAASAVVIPDPTRTPVVAPDAAIRRPQMTRAPIMFHGQNSYYALDKRNVLSDVASGVDSVAKSWGSVLGTDLPSFFTEGIPNWFQDFPTGSQVLSRLGVGDDSLASKPTEVLNIPPYANWTDRGWNVRFHGNVYKIPDIDQKKVDELANIFLIDTKIQDLPQDQQEQARNLTRSIFVVQQGDRNVSFHLEPASSQGASGQPGGSPASTPQNGSEEVQFPYPTTDQGDFDSFVQIQNFSGGSLLAGNETSAVQRLNVYTNGTNTGNATAYLVPPNGITFISDIDDILRVTKIYNPKEGLLNSFARPFTPWMNMPEIYANWSRSLPNSTHFHYLTTTPEQVTRNYMDFIFKTYPGGSFDTRPLNFSDVSATLSIRKFLLTKVFETYPERKFVLIADTSNSDVMKDYPELAHNYPNQVQCILLRNTSATDSEMWFPYDTSGFKGLNNKSYMFFKVPDDLRNLDISSGHCLNETIPQNVSFSRQSDGYKKDSAAQSLKGSAPLGLLVALLASVFILL